MRKRITQEELDHILASEWFDLIECDLSGLDLRDADLSKGNFHRANLTGATGIEFVEAVCGIQTRPVPLLVVRNSRGLHWNWAREIEEFHELIDQKPNGVQQRLRMVIWLTFGELDGPGSNPLFDSIRYHEDSLERS